LRGKDSSQEIRIVIPTENDGRRSVRWHSEEDVFETLAARGAQLDALVWGRRPRDLTRRSWRFPLLVGVTGEDEMREVRRLIEQEDSHCSRLFRYCVLGEDGDHCDLLFTTSHPDAIGGRQLGAASTIVFLRHSPDHAERERVFDHLNSLLRCAANAFISAPVNKLAAVKSVLTHLTHDESVDVAIWNSVKNEGDLWIVSGELPLPVIIGDPAFLWGTRLRHTIERSVVEYEDAGLRDAAAWMRNIAAQYGFLRESFGATEFVNKLEETKSQLNSARASRWIQAAPADQGDLHRLDRFGNNNRSSFDEFRERIEYIVQGAWNVVKIWIGPQAAETGRDAFPELDLGDFDNADLQVMLKVDDTAVARLHPYGDWFSQLSSPPPDLGENRDALRIAVTEINLPRAGTSTFGWFAVWVPHAQAKVYGQLVILLGNRAFQGARVTITSAQEGPRRDEGRFSRYKAPDAGRFESQNEPRDKKRDKKRDESRGSVSVQPESPIRSRTDDIIDMNRFDATLLASGKDERL